MNFTGDQVRAAALAAGITRVDHHRCSFCDHMVFYSIVGEQLFFNSACGCSWSPPEPRTWESVASWLNYQSTDEARRGISRSFGLDVQGGNI